MRSEVTVRVSRFGPPTHLPSGVQHTRREATKVRRGMRRVPDLHLGVFDAGSSSGRRPRSRNGEYVGLKFRAVHASCEGGNADP